MAYNKTESVLAGIEARKHSIIAAVIDIVGKHGIEGVKTDAIAQRAKVSSGLIFKYFADINELIAATSGFVLERDLAAMSEADDLVSGIRALLKQRMASPAITRSICSRSEYRTTMRNEMAELVRAAGIQSSPLMSAMIVGAVIEASLTIKPRDELTLIHALFRAMGVRVKA